MGSEMCIRDSIIMAYQKHFHDDVNDQIWIRAMHNFGGPKANKKK